MHSFDSGQTGTTGCSSSSWVRSRRFRFHTIVGSFAPFRERFIRGFVRAALLSRRGGFVRAVWALHHRDRGFIRAVSGLHHRDRGFVRAVLGLHHRDRGFVRAVLMAKIRWAGPRTLTVRDLWTCRETFLLYSMPQVLNFGDAIRNFLIRPVRAGLREKPTGNKGSNCESAAIRLKGCASLHWGAGLILD